MLLLAEAINAGVAPAEAEIHDEEHEKLHDLLRRPEVATRTDEIGGVADGTGGEAGGWGVVMSCG